MLKEAGKWAEKKFSQEVNSKNFWSYKDITLKRYLDIARTGNLALLAKRKGYAPATTLYQIWEDIVRKNGEENQDLTYGYYHDLEENYGMMLADYVAIKATIAKLVVRYNEEDLNFLIEEKGYKLPKFDKSNPAEYANVIDLANKRCEDLNTRMALNRREVDKLSEGKKVDADFPTLDKLIADLSVDLPFELKDDITLLRYNAYKRKVQERKRGGNKNVIPEDDGRD